MKVNSTIANICIKIFRFRKNIYISGTEILDFPKKVYFTIIRPDDGYVLDYQCCNICDSSNASLLFFKRKLCLWFLPSVRGWSALCLLHFDWYPRVILWHGHYYHKIEQTIFSHWKYFKTVGTNRCIANTFWICFKQWMYFKYVCVLFTRYSLVYGLHKGECGLLLTRIFFTSNTRPK